MRLICHRCESVEPWPTDRWECPCGAPREMIGLAPFAPDAVDPREPGLWRYRAMLPPLPATGPVTLGEGFTPLISGIWEGLSVYWKLEYLNPTGAFKDRGTALVVNDMVSRKVDKVVEDSSGNAGASLAAYAARAGVQARIYVPEHASPAKKAQIAVYGAELVSVSGPRIEATRAAEEATTEGVVYASHVWHPLTLIGMTTIAWEVWEQLGGRAPDWFISPVGQGTLLLGAWRGFQTLAASGLIERLPRLVAAQAERCAPIAEAMCGGKEDVEGVPPRPTIAEGVAIVKPVRGRALLQALRESRGLTPVATEDDIVQAQKKLASVGLYVEPTSAAAVAVLPSIRRHISSGETVVVALTGSGLKSPVTMK
ncbi:MAG: pyridoxal-phosphate dependent enzyme [Proteobacteria bacterium]|nr:pyridoxal-phosphate dependent enzyme [Pseudomonadota bacterium]